MKLFKHLILISIHLAIASPEKLTYVNVDEVLRIAKKHLPENPIILEAGAYDGAETISMKKYWPQSKIYSFEPNPKAFEVLKKNTLKLSNVFLYDLALSCENGFATFYLSEFKHDTKKPGASSSLLKPEKHIQLAPFIAFKNAIQVKTITLDTWMKENNISNIDFLWLDLQGSALDVLKNGLDVLKTVKAIYIELEFVEAYKGQPLYDEVKAWIESQGFSEIAIDFDKSIHWFGNSLFIRTSY